MQEQSCPTLDGGLTKNREKFNQTTVREKKIAKIASLDAYCIQFLIWDVFFLFEKHTKNTLNVESLDKACAFDYECRTQSGYVEQKKKVSVKR